MTEKERELRQKMAQKQEHIQGLLAENRLDDAEAATKELRGLKREYDLLKEVEDLAVAPPPARTGGPGGADDKLKNVDATHVMAQLLRGLGNSLTEEEKAFAKATSVMNAAGDLREGTAEKGGFIVPVDAQTKINELKRTLNPLSSIVHVENVNTMSGTRVFEKAADITPFASVAELATIDETDAPQFAQVKYTISKYAGILPISDELLADTDTALLDYVTRWLAKKAVVTENGQILAKLKTLAKAPLTNLDSIKDVLNVTLDPAISLLSTIVTNQDGFNYLDKLKDTQGRYMLQPNPLDPTKPLLFSKPVTMVSNKVLPTEAAGANKKVPVLIGSFEDAIALFDRQANTLTGTAVGGKAWERDSYDIRAVLRFDVQKFDDQAAVYGELTLT